MLNIIPTKNIIRESFFTDFETEAYLPPIVNQRDYLEKGETDGQCMSVALVETIQAKHNVASLKEETEFIPRLSTQQLVDAMTPKPPLYEIATLQYAVDPGVCSEKDYLLAPSVEGRKLKDIEGFAKHKIFGYKRFDSKTNLLGIHDKEKIIEYGNRHGPLVADIMVTKELRGYKSGILTGKNFVMTPDSRRRIVSHAATLIGYGVARSELGQEVPYWICRNNWGPTFGENALFRIDQDLVLRAFMPAVRKIELSEKVIEEESGNENKRRKICPNQSAAK